MPPNAVSCGVLGSFKKLNTELPPIVCEHNVDEVKMNSMITMNRNPAKLRKLRQSEKSGSKPGANEQL